MINVGMRKDHDVDLVGCKRKLAVFFKRDLTFALIEPTVQENLFPVMMDQVH